MQQNTRLIICPQPKIIHYIGQTKNKEREVIDMDDNVYWEFLEKLRESGATNMYGAVPNLIFEFGISYEKATEILLDWMENKKKSE